jgi:hypothetical protein
MVAPVGMEGAPALREGECEQLGGPRQVMSFWVGV